MWWVNKWRGFDSVYDGLKRLVYVDESLASERKEELLQTGHLLGDGPKIFIYCLSNNNKTNPKKAKIKKELSVAEIQNKIIELVKKLPRPL